MIKYRSDIDGLRAVAVMSVILYHFGFAAFSGGYVGVDIFFVISGFLIGRGVIEASLQNSFSIVRFAERRIRRLYPALFVMLVCTTIASFALLLPGDLREYGKSLVAASLNVSNIQFYRESGYFDPGAVNKPLLHTWSLAIEEQFYIVLPLGMWILTRLRLNARAIYILLVLLSLASFAAGAWLVTRNQPAAFFLFLNRFWELGAGIAVAYALAKHGLRHAWQRSLATIAGAAAIGWSVIAYTEATVFPGLNALLPVVGTCLVIAAGHDGDHVLTRILTSRIFIFVGLISYSLYLWHWPIFVFSNYYLVGSLSPWSKAVGIAATFLLATVSWRFVEQPFRGGRYLSTATLFKTFALLSVLTVGTGIMLWKLDGTPQRYSAADRALASAAGDFLQSQGVCDAGPINLLPGLHVCRIGRLDVEPTVLVWGDSHARAFRDGLDDEAKRNDVAALLVWQGGCPPLIGVRTTEKSPTDDKACGDATKAFADWLAENRSIGTVLMIGRWAYYAEGIGLGNDVSNRITIRDETDAAADRELVFSRAFERTARWLKSQGRAVVVLDPVPEIGRSNARVIAQSVLTGRTSLTEAVSHYAYWPRPMVDARQTHVLGVLARLEDAGLIDRISLLPIFCNPSRCSSWKNGQIMYFDNNHLTVSASKSLSDAFAPAFSSMTKGSGVQRDEGIGAQSPVAGKWKP